MFFSAPKNYRDMLNKIGWFTFINLIILFIVLRSSVESIDVFLTLYEPTYKVKILEVELGIFNVIIPAIIAFIARTIKLHDLISDIIGIRKQFDVNYIMRVICTKLDIAQSNEKLLEHRYELMYRMFYNYASSTDGENKIDKHYIEMALDQWTWFWILEEFTFFAIILLVVLLIMSVEVLFWILILIIIVAIVIMRFSYKKSISYANVQIDLILKDKSVREQIKGDVDEVLS